MSQEHIFKCNYTDLEYMKDDIIRIIERSSNCYLTALDLMVNAPDFYKIKSRIAYKVMLIFQEWLKDRKNADEHLLNLEIKIKALYAVLEQSNRSLIILVCEIYKISEDGNKLYHIIENLIRNNRFPEAAICIMTLNLQDKFELEDVVIPLLLQNNHNLVEDFIKSNRDLQIKLVMYLDNLHCNLSESKKVLNKFSSLKGLRRDQLNNKSIDKLLKKLLKNYNIPSEDNIDLQKEFIMELICMNDMECAVKWKDITEDCWNDMIKIIIEDNIDLQKEFIMELICMNDMECAVKWVTFLNLPIREFPPSLQKAYEENKNNKLTLTFKREDETDSSNYLQLRLNFNKIHMIDTPEEYLKCLNDISENAIVGIDAEWKPSLGFQKSRVALLQLAVWDNIYLLDMIQLRKCLKPDQWDVLLEKIFCNNELIKLGYGLQNDFDMLKEFFEEGKDKLKTRANILDLCLFYDKLNRVYPKVTEKFRRFKSNENTLYSDHKGLSGLSEIILGKPLSKEECTSNWENRPLRKSQVIYAALDAYCLLEIYESIHNKVHLCGLDFDQIVRDFLSQKVQKVSSKKKTSQKNKKKFSPPLQTVNNSPCTIKDVKFVVDNMLHGLGKFLRKCGSDTKCLENLDDHTEAAKIALKEDRIILTSGAPYFQLKSYLPEGRCFNVPCSQNAKEQAMTVFRHFNIKINEEDIFSRCSPRNIGKENILVNWKNVRDMERFYYREELFNSLIDEIINKREMKHVCNGDDYLEIDNYQMKEIWTRYHQCYNKTSEDRHELSINNEKIFITNINSSSSSSPINIKIQISELSVQALNRIENFLLCTNCGKIYWQGSHFDRMRKAMSNILTETGQTIYSINDVN
ncbi:exonuclease mut-7 homolog [Centruroides sculpturatus]|uniref:exonuclease mut-7 homolog n=1 Tax=Centruroides sculpturatus TaxID=218467 RepID=UPI000C6E287A|nr:exonuclease mut-7 homolog [Centruroides sculpturatus]